MDDHKCDEKNMKIKPILIRCGGTIATLKFDEKRFFNTLISFTPYWDFKVSNAIHADTPGVYTSEEVLNPSTIENSLLKRDAIDGSLVNGIQKHKLFSFVLNKPPDYKIFCKSEKIHCIKKINLF